MRVWMQVVMRRARLHLQIAVLVLLPGAAAAKFCGDDVAGRAIACACGDTVVSDVVLADDPVGRTVCPADGLIVRAIDATRGVTVDLHGRTLRGNGKGTGVWILNGGPGGARVVSHGRRARIEGFRDGIVAHGTNSVALLEEVAAIRSTRDGVRIQAPSYTIHAVATQNSGRDGFSLGGTGFHITASRAVRSGRFGYFVVGRNGAVGAPRAGNSARVSGHAAFNLAGVGHQLIDCLANSAGKEGVRLNGMHFVVRGCVASNNSRDGIAGTGGDVLLSGNRAVDNSDNGLVVHGVHVVDGGGNSGAGNHGEHQQGAPTQCEIGGAPCVP